jgi:hypothetical protein
MFKKKKKKTKTQNKYDESIYKLLFPLCQLNGNTELSKKKKKLIGTV